MRTKMCVMNIQTNTHTTIIVVFFAQSFFSFFSFVCTLTHSHIHSHRQEDRYHKHTYMCSHTSEGGCVCASVYEHEQKEKCVCCVVCFVFCVFCSKRDEAHIKCEEQEAYRYTHRYRHTGNASTQCIHTHIHARAQQTQQEQEQKSYLSLCNGRFLFSRYNTSIGTTKLN